MLSQCTDCQHREICRYKDEYDKLTSDITVKVPEPFTLTLVCKHYYTTATYLGSGSTQYYNLCNSNSVAQLSSYYK